MSQAPWDILLQKQKGNVNESELWTRVTNPFVLMFDYYQVICYQLPEVKQANNLWFIYFCSVSQSHICPNCVTKVHNIIIIYCSSLIKCVELCEKAATPYRKQKTGSHPPPPSLCLPLWSTWKTTAWKTSREILNYDEMSKHEERKEV